MVVGAHWSRIRSRVVTTLVATVLFVVPVVAQDVEVTIEYNECFLMCHRFAKHAVEVMGATEEVASGLFVTCMNRYCGGMGEGTS